MWTCLGWSSTRDSENSGLSRIETIGNSVTLSGRVLTIQELCGCHQARRHFQPIKLLRRNGLVLAVCGRFRGIGTLSDSHLRVTEECSDASVSFCRRVRVPDVRTRTGHGLCQSSQFRAEHGSGLLQCDSTVRVRVQPACRADSVDAASAGGFRPAASNPQRIGSASRSSQRRLRVRRAPRPLQRPVSTIRRFFPDRIQVAITADLAGFRQGLIPSPRN